LSAILFDEDFSSHEPGPFSPDVGPHTEYHFLAAAAPKRGWSVASFYHDETRSAWSVLELPEGRKAMAQRVRNPNHAFTHPTLCAGDPFWTDYRAELTLRPRESAGRRGLLFRYGTSRRHYAFCLSEAGAVLLRVREERAFRTADEETLARAEYPWVPDSAYDLWVEVSGDRIRAGVSRSGGGPPSVALEAVDGAFPRGKIGIMADGPTEFLAVRVAAKERAAEAARTLRAKAGAELEELRAGQPRPALWKRLDTAGFGVGRNLRFGDLDGDGKPEILVPQVRQHGPRDCYAEVGGMTALGLDGRTLWSDGTPDPDAWFLTNDVAVQIHDLDGDGATEVVYCRNQEIVIAEGATGKVMRRSPTPGSCAFNDRFPRILGDCLFFCDVRGQGHAGDLVLKDRYWNFWVFDDRLELLWSASCNTGHYPAAADIDGDGKDELFMGYCLFDHDGRLLWSLDGAIEEHADGIIVANFRDPLATPDRVFYAASDAGAVIADLSGTIVARHRIGHAQNPVALKLRGDLPGLQTATVNFWGNQGILTFFDADGRVYHRAEPVNMGSACIPVNWKGDGTELILLNADSALGGLIDGWSRQVVVFPDDGHPALCCTALDLAGDPRDELIVWDERSIWIYTQEDSPGSGSAPAPKRLPLHNESNYRANLSIPRWRKNEGSMV
jgi:hypothetical protein